MADRARVTQALRAMARYLLAKFGWFLLVVGLIPVGMGLVDEVTCRRADATIERVSSPQVLVSFDTASGRRIRIWASLSKLGLKPETAVVGTRTRLLYRGEADGRPYLAETFSAFYALLGLGLSSVGALLLAVRRRIPEPVIEANAQPATRSKTPPLAAEGRTASRPRTVERRSRGWG